MSNAIPQTLELPSPEVKQYQRQKLTLRLAALGTTLAYLGVLAFGAGPSVNALLRDWLGESPWLRLLGVLVVTGGGVELLTLPLSFWSDYDLEHRYQLSNQTPASWIKKQLLAWLVGGVI